jgi:rhamnosyltransferase
MSASRPRVVVALAAFNGRNYIDEQLESILQQQDVDVHVVVSVDKSVDGTENYLAGLALAEPRLSLLAMGQGFGGAGRNFYRLLREIDLSGFDYLCFADQDDLWDRGKLGHACRLMASKGAAGYSSNFTAFWPSGKERLINKAWPQQKWDFLFESAGPGCTYVLGSSLALALQKLVREADSHLLRIDYHDWLAYAFARSHNYPWLIDHWSSMKYRQHANNQIGVNSGWRAFWLRARKILSGYGFEQSRLIADVIGISSAPIVRRGLHDGRLGFLWLALACRHCRRRPLDQLWFFFSCVLSALVKPKLRDGV